MFYRLTLTDTFKSVSKCQLSGIQNTELAFTVVAAHILRRNIAMAKKKQSKCKKSIPEEVPALQKPLPRTPTRRAVRI